MSNGINHNTRYDEICKPKFKALEKALIAFKKKIEEFEEKLVDFEKMLKDYTVEQIISNGTEATMAKLDETIQGHIKEHQEYLKEKRQGQRKFWMTLSTGIITGLIITLSTILLMKVF